MIARTAPVAFLPIMQVYSHVRPKKKTPPLRVAALQATIVAVGSSGSGPTPHTPKQAPNCLGSRHETLAASAPPMGKTQTPFSFSISHGRVACTASQATTLQRAGEASKPLARSSVRCRDCNCNRIRHEIAMRWLLQFPFVPPCICICHWCACMAAQCECDTVDG